MLHEGYQVVLLKRSFSRTESITEELARVASYDVDRGDWKRLFDEHRIDLIVHCATNYGRRNESAASVVEANLILPLQLIQLGKEHAVRGFINSDTILDKRISHYSLSKHQFLEWFDYFADAMACVNVALEHFYGPFDDPSKFVTWVIRAMLGEVDSLDFTPGDQKREFVYIDDVVSAFMYVVQFALGQQRGTYRFEVGASEKFELKQLVQMIRRITGNVRTALKFGALPYRPHEVMEPTTNSAALEALGWKACVPLEDGLTRTIMQERRAMEFKQ